MTYLADITMDDGSVIKDCKVVHPDGMKVDSLPQAKGLMKSQKFVEDQTGRTHNLDKMKSFVVREK